jgi:hypothetical protein
MILLAVSCSTNTSDPVKETFPSIRKDADKTAMVTKFYNVSAGFIEIIDEEDVDLKEYFKRLGVTFPKGSHIKHVSSVSRLVVTNTLINNVRVEEILQQLNIQPTQIRFTAEVIKVNRKYIQLGDHNTLAGVLKNLANNKKETITSFRHTSMNGLEALISDIETQAVTLNDKGEIRLVDIGHTLEVTGQVDPDGYSAQVEFKWIMSTINGEADVLVAGKKVEVNLISKKIIETCIMIWDGETFYQEISGKGAKERIFLKLRLQLVRPDGFLLRPSKKRKK